MFYADLLQYNYAQMMDKFGCTKPQAKAAIAYLESMGVIQRVFRTVRMQGNPIQVMYIALDSARLIALTNSVGKEPSEPSPAEDEPSPAEDETSPMECDEPLQKFMHPPAEIYAPPCMNSDGREVKSAHITYTQNYNPTLTSALAYPSIKIASDEQDDMKETAEKENTKAGKAVDQIPLAYCSDKIRMQTAIRDATEYDFRLHNGFGLEVEAGHGLEEPKTDAYRLMVDCLIEMACARKTQVYGDSQASATDVVAEINRILRLDKGYLTDFVEDASDAYLVAKNRTGIMHPRAYIKAVLWDRLCSYPQNSDIA